jgi:hypothetical protein
MADAQRRGQARNGVVTFLRPDARFRPLVHRPENVLRVAWQPGQLVLFDNRIT